MPLSLESQGNSSDRGSPGEEQTRVVLVLNVLSSRSFFDPLILMLDNEIKNKGKIGILLLKKSVTEKIFNGSNSLLYFVRLSPGIHSHIFNFVFAEGHAAGNDLKVSCVQLLVNVNLTDDSNRDMNGHVVIR